MAKAAESVRSLHWDVVHAEKFHLTPHQLFRDLTRNAEALVRRHEKEDERRARSLQPAAGVDESAVGARVGSASLGQKDKFNLDLEKFKHKMKKKCPHWSQAVRYASLVNLDEIRTLLEIHYDEACRFITNSAFCIRNSLS